MTISRLISSFVILFSLTFEAGAAPSDPPCRHDTCTAACFDVKAGKRILKPQFLKRVRFQRNGFAVLDLEPWELVAINRKGEVVIPGIVSGDFDYQEAEEGIAAFYVTQPNKKPSTCGYFQLASFKIVIPPVYNICGRFYRQKAYVCTECAFDCEDCHNYEYYGGDGYVINKHNQVLKHISLPRIPRCSTVELRGGFPKDQPCRPE